MKASTLILVSLVVSGLTIAAAAQTLQPPNLIDYQQQTCTNACVLQFSENITEIGNKLFVIANCSTNDGLLATYNCLVGASVKTSGGQSYPFTLLYHGYDGNGNLGSDVWYLVPQVSGAVKVNVGFNFSFGQLDAAEEQVQREQ